MRLLAELKEHGVQLYPASSAIRIERDAVRFIDKGGAEQAAAADHVIVAKGATGDLTLADQLQAQGFTVHVVGDAKGVGYIEGAMRGAAQAVEAIAG